MSLDFPESDWKVFRRLDRIALERFCESALGQVMSIASDSSRSHHERYLELYKLVQSQDRELGAAFNDLKRSTALWKLARIYSLGLLTEEEFGELSEATRERVVHLLSAGRS
jgi:hypothetical protein